MTGDPHTWTSWSFVSVNVARSRSIGVIPVIFSACDSTARQLIHLIAIAPPLARELGLSCQVIGLPHWASLLVLWPWWFRYHIQPFRSDDRIRHLRNKWFWRSEKYDREILLTWRMINCRWENFGEWHQSHVRLLRTFVRLPTFHGCWSGIGSRHG
jgi:hypothetical protein